VLRKEKGMVQETTRDKVFREGKMNQFSLVKKMDVEDPRSIREHGWLCNLVMYVLGQ
jgi:hypothetical protein